MEVTVYGAGNEVGRSAVLAKGKENVLFDCGVKIQPEPPKYPELPDGIDACIISHAHLDHCGSIPALFSKSDVPVYMTDVTLELASLLIKDSMKVARKNGYPTPFGKAEFKHMKKNVRTVGYGQKFRIGEFSCTLHDAGHIPGSAGALLNADKKIFYTGDIQTADSRLLRGCRLPKEADMLIIESTYAKKDHPVREKEEHRLIEAVEEALHKDEVALIPVFAVGRAQEVLLILEKYANKIALDGMTKAASDIIADYSYYLKDRNRFRNVLKKVRFVHPEDNKEKIMKKHPIIISSAGMLGGGPAISYLRYIQKRHHSKILFTGFLVEESPGKNLIATKIFKNAEEQFHVHCDLQQFELSAHAGKSGLFEIIEKLNPKQVICVHGEHCEGFAKEIRERFGIDAFAPKNGETIRV